MSNPFFDWPASINRFIERDTARAADVNDAFDAASAGFDLVNVEAFRALKLPIGDDGELLESAILRANKVLAFDASGNPTVSANDVDQTAIDAAAAAASQSAAAASASSASGSASSASGSASAASSSAASALSSANTADSHRSAAAASAAAALASQGSASGSASAAATSESNAAGSASAASTSASNASSSASAAATSASNAATSETNAAASASSAAASFDSFDDRYLGAKASDPSVDNDGAALLLGALYYNSTSGEMRVWNGSAWVAAYISDVAITNHIASTSNPHSVTKAQVGLGNVDNTSNATERAATATLTNKTLTSPVVTQNIQVISTGTTAVRSRVYVLTASLTLTLPASPSAGDSVTVVNRSATTTPVIGRNGQNIMGLAEDMTLDGMHAPVSLVFADATRGWVIY